MPAISFACDISRFCQHTFIFAALFSMTDVNSRMMSSAQCTQTGAQVPRAHARRVMCSNQMYTRSRARQPFRAATSAGLSHSACTAAASARSSPAAEGCLPSHSPHPARQIISRSSAKRRSWSQPAGGRRPVAASAGASGIEETDVVIIGGGLAGLGAALALQKAGEDHSLSSSRSACERPCCCQFQQ